MAVSSTFTATDGDACERQMGRWSRRLAEPFLDFAGPADAGHVLDLGCGTGSLALAARNADSRVTGLDFSSAYVECAPPLPRRTLRVQGRGRLRHAPPRPGRSGHRPRLTPRAAAVDKRGPAQHPARP